MVKKATAKTSKTYDILTPRGEALTVRRTKKGDKITKKYNNPRTYKKKLKSES